MHSFDERLHLLIDAALKEDIGEGDHSVLCCIPPGTGGKAILKVKEAAVLAGVEVARKIFSWKDPRSSFIAHKKDGDPVLPNDIAFELDAHIDVILQCERLVLNCMQRMSGIATLTHKYADKLKGYHTKLLDTRKSTPNFRLLEKEAVVIGGGMNHRFGLFDMIMLKDNHIDYCGGITRAISLAHQYRVRVNPQLKIEIETRSISDVQEVLRAGNVDRILLDNFSPEKIKEALQLISGKIETEASGGITLTNIVDYAQTGVDYISSGALIHQATSIDLSLKAVIS